MRTQHRWTDAIGRTGTKLLRSYPTNREAIDDSMHLRFRFRSPSFGSRHGPRAILPAARAQRASVEGASLHAEPRSDLARSQRRSLHRLLPVHLRRMDGQESHSARPGRLERLRQAHRGERRVSVGNPRGRLPCLGGSHACPAEDRRLFRRLHGRSRRPASGRRAAQTGPRGDRRPEEQEGAGRAAGPPAHREQGRRIPLRLWLESGFRRCRSGHRLRRRGRPRPAGPRLLHQDRREIAGDPDQVRPARRSNAGVDRRDQGTSGRRCEDGHGDRNRACPRLAHARPIRTTCTTRWRRPSLPS